MKNHVSTQDNRWQCFFHCQSKFTLFVFLQLKHKNLKMASRYINFYIISNSILKHLGKYVKNIGSVHDLLRASFKQACGCKFHYHIAD